MNVFDIIEAGVALGMLVMFVRGDIMAKSTVDRILAEAEKRSKATAKIFAKELGEELAQSIEKGFKNGQVQD